MADFTFDPTGTAAARAYLNGLSDHPGRRGDTSNMNPEFAVRMANAIQQAKAAGLPVGLKSGFREPWTHPSSYDLSGDSSHTYGVAGDVSGLDGANGNITTAFAPFATANGLHNPYGIGDTAEYNHWQLPPQPLETTPELLASLKAAKATGNFSNVWNAYDTGSAAAPAQGTTINSRPVTPTPGTPVNDFYHTAMMHESGGKNIPNAAGGWSAAGGYYQFTPPTWSSVRAAHPELNLPANAMDANLDQQTAAYHALVNQNVTALQGANLPINDKNVFMASFLGGGGATKFLTAMNQNPNAAAAELFPKEAAANPTVFYANGKPRSLNDVYALQTGKFGTGNTTGYGPDATAVASAAAPAAAGGAAGATGTAAGGGGTVLPGFGTQQASDAFLKSSKGLEKAMGKSGDGQGQGGPPDIQPSQMVGPPSSAQNVSPLLAMIPMTYGQTINSLQNPLTWNSNPPSGRPPGAGVGGQSPMGTSLNSMAMMDPNTAQFPQVYPSGMGYMGMGYSYPGGGMPYG